MLLLGGLLLLLREAYSRMETARLIHIANYDYPLPQERIARYPVPRRDESKLLVYRHGIIKHRVFRELPELFNRGDLMVFNNTKVIQARLHFRKQTGALIEIFCLEPYEPNDYQLSFDRRATCKWTCLVGNKKKWKEGTLERKLCVDNADVDLSARVVDDKGENSVIEFSWTGGHSFAEILEAIGELPIPPYLNRPTEESDKRTYQTVYSKIDGSVAAPTAGLHFTSEVLAALREKGVELDELTLHVGAGTFRPVKSDSIGNHTMHSETIYVHRESIEKLLRHTGRCTAVGTTSVRTLERLYYMGVKIMQDPGADLHIDQWFPYSLPAEWQNVPTEEALRALLNYMTARDLNTLHTSTQIIIVPGYRYRVVEQMITNFHMPRSTLLLLVAAFIGEQWREVYNEALQHDYRFLSYGDSSLLIP